MALKKCHECGKEVSTTADKCPNCGAPVHKSIMQSKIGCLGLLGGIFLFLIIIANIEWNNPTPPDPKIKKEIQAVKEARAAFLKMSSKEHLIEGKRALADGYKPHKDPTKTSWGNVSSAKRHINAIKESDPEYTEAKIIKKEIIRREKEIQRLSKIVARHILIQQRKTFADELERQYLSKGMDVSIILSGAESTIIRLKYVLFNRPLVYQLTNESDFLKNLKKFGFKKVIFDDGYQSSWTYDLTKN